MTASKKAPGLGICMNMIPVKSISVFIAASYLLALLLDVMSLQGLMPPILWGFLRMWSVAIAVILCLLYLGGINMLKRFLKFSIGLLKLYLLSPLMVYAALGIYILIAIPLNLFDLSAYIDLFLMELRRSGAPINEMAHLVPVLAYAQIALSYLAAITLNMVFALGEEIGWRGYLYTMLGSKTTVKSALIIGVLWSLWHASAIILLGVNYRFNRLTGIPIFTALTVLFTYPQLLLTERAGGSVLPASAFHGAINAIWGLTVAATRIPMNTGELLLGLGLTGILAWTILDLVLYMVVVRKKGSLSEHP